MTRFAWLAVVLPGGLFIVGTALAVRWLLKRARDRQQGIDAELESLIDAKGVRVQEILKARDGEALRQIAEWRRDHADAKRLEAARIESGATSPERLRLVR